MVSSSKSVIEAASPAAVFYVMAKGLGSAGVNFYLVLMFEGLACLCGFIALVRFFFEIKTARELRDLLIPIGTQGWVEPLNSHELKTLELYTDNKDGNGFLLGSVKHNKKSKPAFYKGNSHGLVIAGTEAGKTSSLGKGWVTGLGKHHNRIVTAKGPDIAVACHRYLTQVLKHHVVCIDPYRLMEPHGIESDDYNPCDVLVTLADKRSADIFDKAREIALVLIPEEIGASGENKIFRSVGRQFISNVLIYLAIEQSETEQVVCNLAYLNRLMSSGTEDVIEVFRQMSIMPDYDGAVSRAGKKFLSQFENNPKSAQNFFTETQEALAIFEPVTPIGQSCQQSTFRAEDLKSPDKNMTIFIVLPPEKSGLNDAFAGLCLNSLCTIAIEADRFYPQVSIIADEFENLSLAPLPIIERVLKIGRSRGVRLFPFIQDAKSLRARYGELSSMFWTQAAFILAMNVRTVEEAEEYSKRAGQRAIVTDSANVSEGAEEFGISVKEEAIPLIRADEILRMPKFTALLLKEQNPPLMLDLIHYKMVDPWVHQIDDVLGAPPEGPFPIKFKL